MIEKTSTMKQITNNQDTNWNLYENENGFLYSIAIKEGCTSTTYGNIKHLISIIYKYNAYKISDFTEYGLSLIDQYLKDRRYTRKDLFQS